MDNATGRPEARSDDHPRLGRRASEGVLRQPRLAARRHAAQRGAAHAARLGVLGAVRRHPTAATPGSGKGYLVVSDIDAALAGLAAAGIEVANVSHFGPDFKPVSGVDPDHRSYSSRAEVHDPDGNVWLFQEITTRLPGRVDATTTSYSSVSDLSNAMRRAAIAHGEHEKRIGQADANWPDWYAAYMVAEQAGTELPT